MRCEEVRKRFLEFLDGDLVPTEQQAIQAHLTTCPACARELAEVRGVHQEVGSTLQAVAAAAVPPPRAWLRLRERLGAPSPVRGADSGPALFLRRGWRAALAAVALALLSAFSISTLYPGGLTAFAQEGVTRLVRFIRLPQQGNQAEVVQTLRVEDLGRSTTIYMVSLPEGVEPLDEAQRKVGFPIRLPDYVPHGLVPAGVKVQGPDSVRMVYVGDRPISRLDLVQTRGAREPLLEAAVPGPGTPIVTRTVGGTEVLAVLNPALAESENAPEDDLPVVLMVWERDGFAFYLQVSAWRPGLPLCEALKIVESLR